MSRSVSGVIHNSIGGGMDERGEPLHSAKTRSEKQFPEWGSASILGIQLFDESGFHPFAMLWRELGPVEGQIKRVNCHLSLGVDQSDLYIALLIRKAGSNPVQQTRTILGNYLHQGAGGR